MQFYSVCLILFLCKTSEAIYSFRCPVQAHWKHRSEATCDSWDKYFCVYDQNKNNFSEFCRDNPDFEAPGLKLTISGSIQGVVCDNDFYQPNKFWSSGNSRCAFKKSICSDEGQLLFNNGTTEDDRLCRCDYTKGYDFIVRPQHECYCIPSEEDCSCYNKKCSVNDILSPDYECIDRKTWEPNSNCDSIDIIGLPGHIEAPSTVVPWFETYAPVKYGTENYRQKAWIAILLLVLLPMSLPNTPLKDSITNLENTQVQMPTLVQDFHTETLQDWTSKLAKFVITTATQFIYKRIKENNVIVIVGPTGSGKSANAYHVAFRLKEESGYTIIPARQSTDIQNYHIPDTKQIFVIDDFVGRYTVNETDVCSWDQHWPLLNIIVGNNVNDDTKLILTSRTYIWQPERYACLRLCAYTCDLLSVQISLSLTERWGICQSYLNQDESKALKDETVMMYSFFPSLCSLYNSSENIPVESFFTAPYMMIENEIDNFKMKSPVTFIALAILAIKETISKSSLSIDHHEYDALLDDVFHESVFLQYPSKSLLTSSLVALTGTFVKHVVKKDTDNFMFIHETLQNIVLRCSAKTLIKSVIKNCKTEVLLNQTRLDHLDIKQNVFTIEVSAENEETYFRRLVLELGKGCHKAIFENEKNKFLKFRLRFLKYMKRHFQHDNSGKIQNGLLHVVSALGYKDYVIFFLKDKTMINQKDIDGNIPLHLACMNGQTEIVKYLVRKQSSIDVPNNEGLKPFACACINNSIAVAKYLLHHCAQCINVDEKYRIINNGSVLHIVSAKGFVDLVVLLLENKANVDLQDGSGCTPLHLAENSAVVKALLQCNANINAVDTLGRCPIYFACITKREIVLQFLIKKNAMINRKTINGLRPIHAACQSGSTDIVKMLVGNGAKINSTKQGISPLHEACKVGNESMVKFLIESNASVNHKTKDGFTPLHQACLDEHVSIAKLLLDYNANVDEANNQGWTAILFACAKGFCSIVDLLLQHGANVNICDEDKVSPLMAVCKENHTDVVDLLLRSKANVNHCDKDNCSSLSVACKAGNVNFVNLLLTYGADINLADNDMITPLHAACMNNNNTKLVLKLVENNANVNIADKTGQTPLFKAIFNGYTDIVDILLRHRASVDIRDKSGISPLAIAEIKGHTTIVDVLRQFKHDNRIV